MNKKCARCDKTVYPIEELKCLDKVRLSRFLLLPSDVHVAELPAEKAETRALRNRRWHSAANYSCYYRRKMRAAALRVQFDELLIFIVPFRLE